MAEIRKSNQSTYFALAAFTVLLLAAAAYAAQSNLDAVADSLGRSVKKFESDLNFVGARCMEALMRTSDFFRRLMPVDECMEMNAVMALAGNNEAAYAALRVANQQALIDCTYKQLGEGAATSLLSKLSVFTGQARDVAADLCKTAGVCFSF